MNPFATGGKASALSSGVFLPKKRNLAAVAPKNESMPKRKFPSFRTAVNPFGGGVLQSEQTGSDSPKALLLPGKKLSEQKHTSAHTKVVVGLGPVPKQQAKVEEEDVNEGSQNDRNTEPSVSQRKDPVIRADSRTTDVLARVGAAVSKEVEVRVERLPWDWVPKLKARVASKTPFDWVEGLENIQTKALHDFACEATEPAPPLEEFARGCHYWSHPTFPLPKTVLHMHENPKAELAVQRKMDWT